MPARTLPVPGTVSPQMQKIHRKLRQAGVEAVLHVHEGQAHGGWYRDSTAPESREAFEEIARFFDKHLGK